MRLTVGCSAARGVPAAGARTPRRASICAARATSSSGGSSSSSSSGAAGDARPADHSPSASRRAALLAAAGAALAGGALPAPAGAAVAASGSSLKPFEDQILAYAFAYPTATASGAPLSMVLTRPPEKYSSAAPLSADARQRIVSELFDLRRFVTVSMTVGPASGLLKGRPQGEWKAKEVALTVLVDRSTARLSSGQRTALNDVEEAHAEERRGETYYVFEHLAQGSPTATDRSPETFRHALAVTAVRPGLDGTPYLYTLNLACPEPLWVDLRPQFEAAVASFKLTDTTNKYIAPDKDPWLFF